MVPRSREKEHEQQRINGTENIPLKGCTTKGGRNYDQKTSDRLERGVAWHSLLSGISNICSCLEDARQAKNLQERTNTARQLLLVILKISCATTLQ